MIKIKNTLHIERFFNPEWFTKINISSEIIVIIKIVSKSAPNIEVGLSMYFT